MGGFLTYGYRRDPAFSLDSESDRQVVSAAMTEGLHVAGDRVCVAGRGAGPWSADRYDLAGESSWRSVRWDFSRPDPQPDPVSALSTSEDPVQGRLIAALGHEKAFAWGD